MSRDPIESIPKIASYKQALNAFNPNTFPAHRKITAEEWNALWLSSFAQGNRQERTLQDIININLPIIINKINELVSSINTIEESGVISGSPAAGLGTYPINATKWQLVNNIYQQVIPHSEHQCGETSALLVQVGIYILGTTTISHLGDTPDVASDGTITVYSDSPYSGLLLIGGGLVQNEDTEARQAIAAMQPVYTAVNWD